MNKIFSIAKIVSIDGTNILAELNDILPPYIIFNHEFIETPKINSFVSTKRGLDTIILKVVGIIQKETNNLNYLKLAPCGYIDFNSNKFYLSISQFPFIGSHVYITTEDELNLIYNLKGETFYFGNNIFKKNIKININWDSFFSSHIAIFGNTGYGKSYTISKILNIFDKKIYVEKKSDNIFSLMFDLSGEYSNSNLFKDKTIFFKNGDADKKISINYTKISIDIWNKMLNPSDATQQPLLDRSCKDVNEFYQKNSKNKLNEFKNEIISIYNLIFSSYNIEALNMFYKLISFDDDLSFLNEFKNLYSIEKDYGNNVIKEKKSINEKKVINFETFNEDFKKTLSDIFNNKEEKIKEYFINNYLKLFKFFIIKNILFSNFDGKNQVSFVFPLLLRFIYIAKKLDKYFIFCDSSSILNMFNNSNKVIIDFSLFDDFKGIISFIIMNLIFNEFKEYKLKNESKFIQIIIDECHYLIDSDNENNSNFKIYEKIAREGRKYNIFFILSSQRPYDLSNTILSQINNLIIHKISNNNDINEIKKAISFIDDDIIKWIPLLDVGECAIFGTGLKNPTICKVNIDKEEISIFPNTNNYKFFKN